MDRDLLRQCLTYHGESLFSTLKCEQTENPDFQAVVADLCKAPNGEEQSSPLVEQFIARKADILFSPSWKTATPKEEEEPRQEEAAEAYAVMPPLELFMEVPFEERRTMLYRDLERGDIVVGRINNVREYGFFLTLICMAGGLNRDIEDLELSALCHIKEIPSAGSHDDPLSYYQIGDFIRGDKNLHSVDLNANFGKWWTDQLFAKEDFASVIRKKQSVSWALKCVKAGVGHFKQGRHVEAMNEYNKALDIDTNNVEALVARGALYANKGVILKAISDFELALETCPDHRNAKKYLCQTLVERGKQLEEQEKLVTAEGVYRRALSLDDANPEAQEALRKITETIQNSIRLREEALAKEGEEKAKSSQSSAEKLRKLLKEEKRMKRKRKRSTSSSSSSSSRKSSTSSSSSRRRAKKKKKKKRKSARGGKRRSGRRRSDEGKRGRKRKEDEEDEEAEWYPAPPDTSATFLDQKTWEAFGAAADEEEGEEDGRPRSSERGMGDQRRTAEPQRSSLDERKRRVSCSSSDSAYSRKLGPGKDFSGRNFSLRGGEDQTPSKEDLPANLLDIFQQIAKFQKEKGIEPKKSTNSI
uniref:Tetratricopeptide repeat domain 14 n=1 Tax=Hippocampus comes TaxID=109280 RepID=A0A3Q2Y4V3_HIPCM